MQMCSVPAAGPTSSVSCIVSVGCCKHLDPAGREPGCVSCSLAKQLKGKVGQIALHRSRLTGH